MTELSSKFDFKAVEDKWRFLVPATVFFLVFTLLSEATGADLVKDYYPSGQLRSEMPITGSGQMREYYEDGALKSEISVIDGQPAGLFKTYDKSGLISEEGTVQDNQAIEGKFISYYDTEEIKLEDSIENLPQGYSRTMKEYYKNGKLKAERNFKETFLESAKIYYENGQLKSSTVFDQHQPVFVQRFSEDGRPRPTDSNIIYNKILILPFGPPELADLAYDTVTHSLSELSNLTIVGKKDLGESLLKELAFPDPSAQNISLYDFMNEEKEAKLFAELQMDATLMLFVAVLPDNALNFELRIKDDAHGMLLQAPCASTIANTSESLKKRAKLCAERLLNKFTIKKEALKVSK